MAKILGKMVLTIFGAEKLLRKCLISKVYVPLKIIVYAGLFPGCLISLASPGFSAPVAGVLTELIAKYESEPLMFCLSKRET